MEVFIWFCLISLAWVAVLTVLLPLFLLLKYSKYFRDLWFPFMFTKVLVIFDSKHTPLRKRQFRLLNEKLSERDVTKPLKVLEIGIGSGPNLPYYPDNSHLTALDMNANFESYFKQNQKQYPHIVYERSVTSGAENMKGIDDCSMDLVISTYVLCSVNSMKDALKEIKRVLKPGGHYLFLEHVAYPKSKWEYALQKALAPLCYVFFNHCNLLHNTGDVIKKTGFSYVDYETIYPKEMIMPCRPTIIGIATK